MATDRETRLMSRMLTRGATMLGEHCDDCHNPLFRYDGEVVCPVCAQRAEDAREDARRETENCDAGGAVSDAEAGVESLRDVTGDESRVGRDVGGELGDRSEGSTEEGEQSEGENSRKPPEPGGSRGADARDEGRGGPSPEEDDWRAATADELERLAQRLASEAAGESDTAAVDRRLDALERTLDLLERL